MLQHSPPPNPPPRQRPFWLWPAMVLALLIAILLGAAWLAQPRQPVHGGRPLLAWVADLDSPREEVRAAAREAITTVGAAGVPVLSWALRRGDSWWDRAVMASERSLPRRLWFALLLATKPDEAPRQRAAAARALGLIGPAAAPALPALSQLLRDRQLPVVSETAAAMSAIGPPAVPYLAAALTDTNHASRGQVLTALGNLGPAAAPAAPAIAGVLLAGEDHNAATLAAQTLSRIGPAALPAMVEALSGAGAAAGERLEATLAQLAGSQPGALDALERELRQAPPAVKPALLRAVQQVTTYPRRRALIIARTLADADPALRAAAAEWLRRHASVAELERPLAGEAESLRHLVEAVFRGDESSPASAGR